MLETLTSHVLQFNKLFSNQVLVGCQCPSARESRSKSLAAIEWCNIDIAKKLEEEENPSIELPKVHKRKEIHKKAKKERGTNQVIKMRQESMIETLESIYISAKFNENSPPQEANAKRRDISLMVLYRGDYFEVTATPLISHFEALLDKMVSSMDEIMRKAGFEKKKALISLNFNSKALHYVVEIQKIVVPAGYLPFRKYVYILRASERLPQMIDLEEEESIQHEFIKIEADSPDIWAEAQQISSIAPEINKYSAIIKIEDQSHNNEALFFNRQIQKPFEFDLSLEKQLARKSIAHYSIYWLNAMRLLSKDFIGSLIKQANDENVRQYVKINNSHFELNPEEMQIFLKSFGLVDLMDERLKLLEVLTEQSKYEIVGHVEISEGSFKKMILKIQCGQLRFYLPEDILIDINQEEKLVLYKLTQLKREVAPGIFKSVRGT